MLGDGCVGMLGTGAREGHVQAAPSGRMFSMCCTCMFGIGRSRAAAAGAEER